MRRRDPARQTALEAVSGPMWGVFGFGLFIALASVVQGLLGVSK
jgi:hypothetical protein